MPSWYVFDALTNRPQRVRQIWRLWVIWDRDFWLSAHVASSDIMTHSRTQFSIRFSSDFALCCNSFANSSGKSHNLLCQTLGTLPSSISRTSRGPIMATLSPLPPSTIGYLQYMMMMHFDSDAVRSNAADRISALATHSVELERDPCVTTRRSWMPV